VEIVLSVASGPHLGGDALGESEECAGGDLLALAHARQLILAGGVARAHAAAEYLHRRGDVCLRDAVAAGA